MALKILTVEERNQLYERMRRSIVCIRDERELIGGGVFVEVHSKQMILTCAHVAHGKKNLQIGCFDSRAFNVRVAYIDRKSDLAFLDVVNKPEGGFQCAQLLEENDMIKASETHLIGHPGRLAFSYNVGYISCVERTCGNIYHQLQLGVSPDFPSESNPLFVDDFRGLSASLRLIQAKNLHGGGRFGGTGAPFLNSDGHIVGLYSFTHYEEDYAIHVAEIQKALMSVRH